MPNDSPYIQIEGLYKRFGQQQVLRGVDLSINKGESIAIIGQSGCGKSVLLKHLIRLLDPDRGRILFEDIDIADLNNRNLSNLRRRVGMLFQSAALFDSMTVEENVGLGLTEQRVLPTDEIRHLVMNKLELVGLKDAADKYPAELSGGMRKRVGLARAIANDPEVLLYDEPTTGLDPIRADRINEMIVALNEKLTVTSIVVTHDMKSAFRIADRFIMLFEGKVVFDGTPAEIRQTKAAIVSHFIRGEQ